MRVGKNKYLPTKTGKPLFFSYLIFDVDEKGQKKMPFFHDIQIIFICLCTLVALSYSHNFFENLYDNSSTLCERTKPAVSDRFICLNENSK